jgi:hypothetical protein
MIVTREVERRLGKINGMLVVLVLYFPRSSNDLGEGGASTRFTIKGGSHTREVSTEGPR